VGRTPSTDRSTLRHGRRRPPPARPGKVACGWATGSPGTAGRVARSPLGRGPAPVGRARRGAARRHLGSTRAGRAGPGRVGLGQSAPGPAGPGRARTGQPRPGTDLRHHITADRVSATTRSAVMLRARGPAVQIAAVIARRSWTTQAPTSREPRTPRSGHGRRARSRTAATTCAIGPAGSRRNSPVCDRNILWGAKYSVKPRN